MDGEECIFPFSFPLSLADMGGLHAVISGRSEATEIDLLLSHKVQSKRRKVKKVGHSGVGYIGFRGGGDEEKGGGRRVNPMTTHARTVLGIKRKTRYTES